MKNDDLINTLNKKFGDNAIFRASDVNNIEQTKIKRMPTASLALDIALGGGLPLGKFIHICGNLSSTKTTQSLHLIRIAQEHGHTCALIDAENTTDTNYLQQLGVNVEDLLYSNPSGMEEALEMVLFLQQSGKVDFIVLDSLAALSPNKEQESSMSDSVQMCLSARLLNEFFRKYQANNNKLTREGKSPLTLICINQLREKPGVMMGNPEYAPGGRSIGFACTVDLVLKAGETIKEGTKTNPIIVGHKVKFKINKNKTYGRGGTGSFDFYIKDNSLNIPAGYNDYTKDILACGMQYNIINVAGAWLTYGDTKYHGLNDLLDAMRNNTTILEEIKAKILDIAFRNEVN